MRANWFIGLPVLGDGWFETLMPVPQGCRAFAPSDLHLTVAFLGAVSEEKARDAWNATQWEGEPVLVTLGAIVPMGSPRRYSALSVLLEEGRDAIEAGITRSRLAAYAAAGVAADDRPAKAHITVARPSRRATDRERKDALVWARSHSTTTARATPIRVDRIALFTWSEDRASTLFRIVEESPIPRPRLSR